MNNIIKNIRHSVTIKEFASVCDYKADIFNTVSISISKADLIRYAISVGEFSNTILDRKGINFYSSFVEMAFYSKKNRFIKGNSYDHAETSIKATISFLIGMVSAKCIAEKKYQIAYLFHLKEPQITKCKGGKQPDFFGISKNNSYIIEAKGTDRAKVNNTTVDHAKTQTKSISQIDLQHSNNITSYTTFEKHIITSSYPGNQFIISDIDPDGKSGDIKITINTDKGYVKHYKSLYNFLRDNETSETTRNGLDFVVVMTDIGEIGIEKEIYCILKEYDSLFSDDEFLNSSEGLNQEEIYISSRIKDIGYTEKYINAMENQEGISLGYDGIVIFLKE